MSPVAAVVGARGVGATHVSALRALGVDVRWIAGLDRSITEETAKRLEVPNWSTSALDVATDDAVDVVHVCAPNHLHAEIASAALRAGKHVVCEKPLTSNSQDAAALLRLSSRSPGLSTLCYCYRYLPLLHRLRSVIAAGEIGSVHAVRGSYLQNWRLVPATDWRSDPAQVGRSRVLADIGSHLLDLAETATDTTVSVHEAMFTSLSRSQEAAQDDDVSVHGRLANGAALSMHLSQVAALHTNTLTLAVDGTAGAAEWSCDGVERLRVASADDVASITLDSHEPIASSHRNWNQHVPDGDPLRRLLDAFYRTLSGAGPDPATQVPLPTFSDGARHIHLSDRAADSLRLPADAPRVDQHHP